MTTTDPILDIPGYNEMLETISKQMPDDYVQLVEVAYALHRKTVEEATLKKAISHYGEPGQVVKCIEELAELQAALCMHVKCLDKGDVLTATVMGNISDHATYAIRACKEYLLVGEPKIRIAGCSTHKHLVSELADVSITTSQMKLIFTTPEEFEKAKQEKLSRLEERMRGDSQ